MNYPGKQQLISVRGWVVLRSLVGPEGQSKWKIPMTNSEIEPANPPGMRHRVPSNFILRVQRLYFKNQNILTVETSSQ